MNMKAQIHDQSTKDNTRNNLTWRNMSKVNTYRKRNTC